MYANPWGSDQGVIRECGCCAFSLLYAPRIYCKFSLNIEPSLGYIKEVLLGIGNIFKLRHSKERPEYAADST